MEYRKKHVTQMTTEEITLINELRSCISAVDTCQHSRERTRHRQVDKSDIIKAIRHGDIVEYHTKCHNSNRVMFKLHLKEFGGVKIKGRIQSKVPLSLYVVFDIVNRVLVTVFKATDVKHARGTYDSSIDIVKNINKVLQRSKQVV